jgi:hypothetical protein
MTTTRVNGINNDGLLLHLSYLKHDEMAAVYNNNCDKCSSQDLNNVALLPPSPFFLSSSTTTDR